MHSYDSGECPAPPHIKYLQRPLACHTCIHRLFIEVLRAGFLLSGAITFFPSSVGRGLFLPDPPRPASLSRTCPPLPYYTCPRVAAPHLGKAPQSTALVATHPPDCTKLLLGDFSDPKSIFPFPQVRVNYTRVDGAHIPESYYLALSSTCRESGPKQVTYRRSDANRYK